MGAKIGRLARWFAREHLDAAAIGTSGGVDSALVLALACAARIGAELVRVSFQKMCYEDGFVHAGRAGE